jgi:hypothetical protein
VNQAAYDAVEEAWKLTVKARALCPYTDDSAVGMLSYPSPPWYRQRGAVYVINLPQPLDEEDVRELNEIGSFINRSFVIWMVALLEAFDVVPYKKDPDLSKSGGDHAQLTKWLRNRFAHGEWRFDPGNQDHVETRELLEKLFPQGTKKTRGFVISIDAILEPLKDGVLEYIRVACA